jgi:hypothetical protein
MITGLQVPEADAANEFACRGAVVDVGGWTFAIPRSRKEAGLS